MPKIDSLNTLLVNELRDLLDAEHRLTKALPKMVKNAASEELRTALDNHLTETEQQITRLESALEMLDETVKAKTCHGMKGIVEEGSEHMGEDFADDSLCDAVIIGSAQKAEHYEIAGYGTAATYARMLGLSDIEQLLEETLQEEKNADKHLTEIAMSVVNPEAAMNDTGSTANGSPTRSNTRRMSPPTTGSRSRSRSTRATT